MVLVDTSVWLDFLRGSDDRLRGDLEGGLVLIHPLVEGELASGSIRQRDAILRLLSLLPRTTVATHQEAMHFLERQGLAGRGVGYVDVHLLASARLTGVTLRTNDRALAREADRLGLLA